MKGAYFQIQALPPLLNRGAAIVLNGSINAHIGMPNSSVYAASKAALISFAKTLSAELLARGVRVNVVSPGPVTTPLYGKLGCRRPARDSRRTASSSRSRWGASARRKRLPRRCCICPPPSPRFIVGTELIVDGGMSQL